MQGRLILSMIFAAGLALAGFAHAQAPSRPSASLYQLRASFSDHNGATFRLGQLSGHPALVVMFYGSCRYACPLLLRDVKAFEAALTPAERAELRVVAVTFDPAADTTEALRTLAASYQVDLARWRFLRGSPGDIRTLANVLGVRYRRLEGGHYSHSNILTLLGPTGQILHQVEGLRQPPGALVTKLREALGRRR